MILDAQLEHSQSNEERCQSPQESAGLCSRCLRSAISDDHAVSPNLRNRPPSLSPTSPRTSGANFVFSKNLTATSPVTTPSLSVSAAEKSCPKTRRSSGLRCRLGCSERVLWSVRALNVLLISGSRKLTLLQLPLLVLYVRHVIEEDNRSGSAACREIQMSESRFCKALTGD